MLRRVDNCMNERRDPFAETVAALPVNGSTSNIATGFMPGTRWSSLSTAVRPSAPEQHRHIGDLFPYETGIRARPFPGRNAAGVSGRLQLAQRHCRNIDRDSGQHFEPGRPQHGVTFMTNAKECSPTRTPENENAPSTAVRSRRTWALRRLINWTSTPSRRFRCSSSTMPATIPFCARDADESDRARTLQRRMIDAALGRTPPR